MRFTDEVKEREKEKEGDNSFPSQRFAKCIHNILT